MITWTEIDNECGDYKAAFVETFNKYKGQSTDERTEQNKVVMVTVSSFARHQGIDERTFRRWIKKSEGSAQSVSSGQRDSMNRSAARKATKAMTPKQRAEIVEELEEDPEVAVETAKTRSRKVDEYKAGADHTKREMKSRMRAEFLVVSTAMGSAITDLGEALTEIRDHEFEGDERDIIESKAEEIALLIGWIKSALGGDSGADWDDEFRRLIDNA